MHFTCSTSSFLRAVEAGEEFIYIEIVLEYFFAVSRVLA